MEPKFSKNDEEFESYYEDHIEQFVTELEKKRANDMGQASKRLPLTIGLIVLCVILTLALHISWTFGFMVCAVIYFSLYRAYVIKAKSKAKKSIFDNVFPYLIKFISPAMMYSPSAMIPSGEFESSGIYDGSFDKYYGEALVGGSIGGTDLAFSDLKVIEIRQDSKGNNYDHTVFEGLFFVIDFNKNFAGYTCMYPERSNPFEGTKHKRSYQQTGDLSVVKLENPVFEKYFEVKSTNNITAHYIFTPAFMEKVVSFTDKSKYTPFISFLNGKMYLALKSNGDIFNFDVSKEINYDVIRKFFSEFNDALAIVDEFGLNIRIFNKQ